MFSHAFYFAPGHGIESVYGIKIINKWFLLQLMSTVQLPGAKRYDKPMIMHTGTRTYDVGLER